VALDLPADVLEDLEACKRGLTGAPDVAGLEGLAGFLGGEHGVADLSTAWLRVV
jgi:hypothetical protein